MAVPFKCSNCGGSEKQTLSATRYKCNYCQTVFYEKKEPVKPGYNADKQPVFIRDEANYHDEYEESSRGAILTVLTLLIAFGSIAFFNLHHTRTQEEIEADRAAEIERYSRQVEEMMDEQFKKIMPPDTLFNSMGYDTVTVDLPNL